MVIFIKNSNVIYKYIVNIFTTCYLFILIISLLSINTYITSEGKEDENLTTMMNIFTFNKTNMLLEASFVSKEELQAINQYSKIIDNKWRENEENLILPSSTQILWVKALTGYDEVDEKNISYYINKWNEGNYKYLMLFKERKPAEIAKQMLKLENTKVIYECPNYYDGTLKKYMPYYETTYDEYEMIENIFTNNDDDIMTNKVKFKERVKFIIYNDDVIIEDIAVVASHLQRGVSHEPLKRERIAAAVYQILAGKGMPELVDGCAVDPSAFVVPGNGVAQGILRQHTAVGIKQDCQFPCVH